MGRALVVKVTCGSEDPERCNQAFTVAAAAVASGAPVSLWLTGEAAWFALPSRAADFSLPLATPLADLLASRDVHVVTGLRAKGVTLPGRPWPEAVDAALIAGCAAGSDGHPLAFLVAGASPFLGRLFTGDTAVHEALVPVLVVVALGQPVAGVVFVLDGVLIGAGDGTYLAKGGLVTLVAYAPVALVAAANGAGLLGVWVALTAVFMGARLVVLLHRARGSAWLVTGA